MPAHPCDEALDIIATYVSDYSIQSEEAYNTARYCLADTLGCGILALKYRECTKLLGPVVPGSFVHNGAKVPGTDYMLDPVRAAFNIGTMIRWLDYNDTWLAAEWAHPSDNLGGILATLDYISRRRITDNLEPFRVDRLLTAMIKAHEVQGSLALLNSFNRIGFDHVILVKVATAAVATWLLGGTKDQVVNALSQAFLDVGPLRTYRHAPNTGSRKSWAAGDATSRGVLFALMTMQGEMGYPHALSAKKWGFYDVLFKGQPLRFERPLGSYVMENVLFKISFPAEFHAQTAVEAALKLHPNIRGKWEDIDSISIDTHESAIRIIDKSGPLKNPADRDHCLQYMVAIGLLFGELTADHYEDAIAKDPRIDALRAKMVVKEHPPYTTDYLHPERRSIANTITIRFKDGTSLDPVTVEYPIGHRRRRTEGIPLLMTKFERNLATHFAPAHVADIIALFEDYERLVAMPIPALTDTLTGTIHH